MSDVPEPNLGLELLTAVFYEDLRRMAHRERRRGRGSETVRTTALVHEAYLKLSRKNVFRDHGHFLATAALAMRQVLVAHSRARLADKRGSGVSVIPLADTEGPLIERDEQIVDIDAALERLESLNPRYARVVECRFFAGMNECDTALALGVTERTVQRDWAKAKAFLYDALEPD